MRSYERSYGSRMALGQNGNMLTMLLAINLLAYVVLGFIKVVFIFRYADSATALSHFHDYILSWFAMPADASSLFHRPWTVLTQLFVHNDFWSVFGNMLWLWSFGYILQDLGGNRRLVPIYIYGGLAGALTLFLLYQYVPSLHTYAATALLFGAGPSVMAIATATMMTAPTYRLFPLLNGGIPLWVLTLIYILIDIAGLTTVHPAYPAAHIAGGLTGILFVILYRAGTDAGAWMNAVLDWTGNLFNPGRPKKGQSIRDTLFYNATTDPYSKKPLLTQQRIDMILDKINQQGYDALTKEEKELLKKAGEEGH